MHVLSSLPACLGLLAALAAALADALADALAEPVTAALYDRAGKLFSDPLAEIIELNGGESSSLNAKVLYIPGDTNLPRSALVATTRVGKTAAGACARGFLFLFYFYYIFINLYTPLTPGAPPPPLSRHIQL